MSIARVLACLEALEDAPEEFLAEFYEYFGLPLKKIVEIIRKHMIRAFEEYRDEINALRNQLARLKSQISRVSDRKIEKATGENVYFAPRSVSSHSPMEPSRLQQAPDGMQQAVVGQQEPLSVVWPLQTQLMQVQQ